MIQDVYIIGATGKVGRELVRQIFEKGDTDPNIHANPTRVVGLASSTHTLYSPQGISQGQAYAFTNRSYGSAQRYYHPDEHLERARSGLRGEESTLVFIDATALGEPMIQFHLRVIEETPHGIVTANKNPVALSDYDTFQRLTQDSRRYGYRCSVMAGAEAVTFVRDGRDLNDPLYVVEGCFSGTNGYITSGLEDDGRTLSSVVKEAYDKGYTEPHPRDDLNGLDVARKLVVIARSAGLPVALKDVVVTPLIPEEYLLEDDVGRFLGNLAKLDEGFRERMVNARSNGSVLRYVTRIDARSENPILEVSLQEVPRDSPLGGLEGAMNKIVLTTEAYPKGYVVEAPGAGLEVTALNIRRDLLDLLPERRNEI